MKQHRLTFGCSLILLVAATDISFAKDDLDRYCQEKSICAHLGGGMGYVEYGKKNAKAQISQGADLCDGIKVYPSKNSDILIVSNLDFEDAISVSYPDSHVVNSCGSTEQIPNPAKKQIFSELSGKLKTTHELDGGAYTGDQDFAFAIGGISTGEAQVLSSREQLVFLFSVPDGRRFITKLVGPKGKLRARKYSAGNAVVFDNLKLETGQWKIEAKDDFNNVISGEFYVVKNEDELSLVDQRNDTATLIESYNRVERNPKQNALSQVNNLIDLGFADKLPREQNIMYRNIVNLMIQSSNDVDISKSVKD